MEISVKDLDYLHTIQNNVKEVDQNQIENFSKYLFKSDLFIPIAEGRSRDALYVGVEPLRGKKEIKTPLDQGFPGKNFEDGMRALSDRYDNIFVVFNTGSGETATPKMYAKQLERIRDEYEFSIGVITSHENSTIGKIGKEFEKLDRGAVIILKGKDKPSNHDPQEAKRTGIMNDIYENASLFLLSCISRGKELTEEKIDKEFDEIYREVDNYLDSDSFHNLLETSRGRNHITVGGIGPSRNVADALAIRLKHVKQAMGDDAYLSGSYAPAPRCGDILIAISESGEPEALLKWCEKFKKNGGLVYSITGKESPLEKNSDFCHILNARDREDFYVKAAFITSPIPLALAIEANLSESFIKSFHSTTE